MRGGRRPGTGRKPIADKRRIRFQTRWNNMEAETIAEAARRAGLKPSQFIRAAALEKARKTAVNE
jgi:uncharacterized protein (DUF1778 family)